MTVVNSGGGAADIAGTANLGFIAMIADKVGVGEAAIRLLLTLFAGKFFTLFNSMSSFLIIIIFLYFQVIQ